MTSARAFPAELGVGQAWGGRRAGSDATGALGALRHTDAVIRTLLSGPVESDAIGNIAVVLAAGGVFGLNSAWPDLAVAALMAVLGISGGVQIMRQARAEMHGEPLSAPASYQQSLHGSR